MGTGFADWTHPSVVKCPEAQGGGMGGGTVSAARTSFCLGMRGPCITFDNEGVSSLTATVLAVQSVVQLNERWSAAGMDCYASLCGASKIVFSPSQWEPETIIKLGPVPRLRFHFPRLEIGLIPQVI